MIGQCKETEFRVKKLSENSMYRFRVCAHTVDGASKWAEYEKDVKAADPYGKPHAVDGMLLHIQ